MGPMLRDWQPNQSEQMRLSWYRLLDSTLDWSIWFGSTKFKLKGKKKARAKKRKIKLKRGKLD